MNGLEVSVGSEGACGAVLFEILGTEVASGLFGWRHTTLVVGGWSGKNFRIDEIPDGWRVHVADGARCDERAAGFFCCVPVLRGGKEWSEGNRVGKVVIGYDFHDVVMIGPEDFVTGGIGEDGLVEVLDVVHCDHCRVNEKVANGRRKSSLVGEIGFLSSCDELREMEHVGRNDEVGEGFPEAT